MKKSIVLIVSLVAMTIVFSVAGVSACIAKFIWVGDFPFFWFLVFFLLGVAEISFTTYIHFVYQEKRKNETNAG